MVIDIECLHPYQSRPLDSSVFEGVALFRNMISELASIDDHLRHSVMIDDYSERSEPQFLLKDFNHKCEELDYNVHLVLFESKLVSRAQELAEKIAPSALVSEVFSKENKRVTFLKARKTRIALYSENLSDGTFKYTCALLTACWYLTRTGYYTELNARHSLCPDLLISILPKEYEENELRALTILESAGFVEIANKVKHVFY